MKLITHISVLLPYSGNQKQKNKNLRKHKSSQSMSLLNIDFPDILLLTLNGKGNCLKPILSSLIPTENGT